MPGVTLLPSTPPANGPMSTPHVHNGSSTRPYGDSSIAEIKQKAKEGVNKEARGVSAITLIKTARTQILAAKEHEARGDLRSAFGSYIRAATLAKMTMDSPEYVLESKGKGGVVRKELNDFLENDGRDITSRTNAVEEKLRAMEKAQAASDTTKKAPLGGSIADRLRALQDNGLSLGQMKLRDPQTPTDPTPPMSPRNFPSVPQAQSHSHSHYASSPLIPAPTQVAPSTSTSSSAQSIHALVSPASLGPPSPSSTPSSSPPNASLLNNYEINGFNQAFPSIDELDEDPAFSLPSVPTGIGGPSTSTGKPPYSPKDFRNGVVDGPSGSPLQSFKNFTVPIERPSSTPLTPINNSFQSRPASPSQNGSANPNSNHTTSTTNNRTIPHKPSGLSIGITAASSASGSASTSRPRTPIPNKNAATPRELWGYLREHNVLLIDVRNRAEFDREHIRANAVVCIEPSVLMRDGVTAESLENAMVIGPRQEASLFINRDKFDLVAVYDASSTSFVSSSSSSTSSSLGPTSSSTSSYPSSSTSASASLGPSASASGPSPLAVLVRVISEQAFKKMLKRMPMMLVGGLEAWKRELGEGEVVRGVGYGGGDGERVPIQRPVPTTGVVSPLLASSASTSGGSGAGAGNPYLNGNGNGGVGVNHTGHQQHQQQTQHHQHELWTPPQRPRGDSGASFGEHRSTMSLDQGVHSRMPADAGYNGIHPPAVNGGRPLSRRPAMLRPSSGSISFTRSMNDTITSPTLGPTVSNGPMLPNSPISYPQFPRHISPASASASTSASASSSTLLSSSSSSTTTYTTPSTSTSTAPTSYTAPLPPTQFDIASPPQASINPSHLSRRRSDFVDQSQEALSSVSGYNHNTGSARGAPGPIDYPELGMGMGMGSAGGVGGMGMGGMGMGGMGGMGAPPIVRPPPPVAAPVGMDHGRQDNRPRVQQIQSPPPSASLGTHVSGGGTSVVGGLTGLNGPVPPRIASDYPVHYWADVHIGTSGLKNLGNTCYMNAPIQCLSATVPFSRFFTEGRWKSAVNYTNPLGSKGKLAGAFAKLLHDMWGGDLPYLTPIDFRRSICQLKSQYNGSDQHDSQEFLSFLIDGIHEDLNRIIAKPNYTPTPEEEAELERLPPQIASDREWRAWRARNDSLIVDFFQGQFRNRLECLTCHKTSTTYNVFSILSLPVPNMRSGKVPIERCIDAFFNEEVLEKDDAWDCPQCKAKRRASKKLSLARLPPVLVIHFKRFEANGRFSDKIDTFVDFPMKSLDLTNYMPPPLPPDADRSQLNGGMPMSLDDPRTQLPPYKYDLYGVTNHYGNLSSGHYTAFIASRGGWMYCDDSSVKPVDPKQVVSQKAYVLFYKRVRS